MLCTPPAFILSQDQTLEIIVLKHPEGWFNLLSSLALSFFYFCLSSILICKNFRDPFQAVRFVLLSCCSIFKDHSSTRFRASTFLLYHFVPRLSSLFSKLFSTFFKVAQALSFACPLTLQFRHPCGQLSYYTTFPPLCQELFFIFSAFFSFSALQTVFIRHFVRLLGR